MRLTAGQRRRLLTDLDIAEADTFQRDQLVTDHRDRFEEADAILDRLVHNAYRVELEGQSFRKQEVKSGDETPAN